MSNDCTGGPDRCDRLVRMDEQSLGHQGTHTMQRTQKSKSSGSSQPRGKQAKFPKSQARSSAPLSKGSKGNGMSKPVEKTLGGRRTIFFEEYVQEIAGSVGFSANSFPIQPGLPTLFAWLATQAISYQEYSVKRLGFRFESEKSAMDVGKLMLAFQQDPSDALPASKQEMLENEHKAKCKTWESCDLRIPERVLASEALGRTRFVRSGALAANLDIKMYDLGQLIVATQGQADTTAIGELYVVYEIELRTPLISARQIALATSALVISGGTVSSAAFLGSVPVITGGLSVTGATNTLTFNRVGSYLVYFRVVGTGLFTSFVPVTSASTASVALASSGGISNAAANAGTVAWFAAIITVSVRGQTAVFDCSTQATTITSSDGKVASYSG